jgi:hypothetical protein
MAMKLIKKVKASMREQFHANANNRQNYSSVCFNLYIFGKPMGIKNRVINSTIKYMYISLQHSPFVSE